MNGFSKTFLRENVQTIGVDAGGGDDVIDIGMSRKPSVFELGGDGNDRIIIRSGHRASITGGDGDDFIDGSGVNWQEHPAMEPHVDAGTEIMTIGSPHDAD